MPQRLFRGEPSRSAIVPSSSIVEDAPERLPERSSNNTPRSSRGGSGAAGIAVARIRSRPTRVGSSSQKRSAGRARKVPPCSIQDSSASNCSAPMELPFQTMTDPAAGCGKWPIPPTSENSGCGSNFAAMASGSLQSAAGIDDSTITTIRSLSSPSDCWASRFSSQTPVCSAIHGHSMRVVVPCGESAIADFQPSMEYR